MQRTILKVLVVIIGILFLIVSFTIRVIDRAPYQEKEFYPEMDQRLDSLRQSIQSVPNEDSLYIGWSKVSITPDHPVDLAGYGNREPKLMDGIHDSAFVRCIVFQAGTRKVALFSADLLIIHPVLTQDIIKNLPANWGNDELYFTATHTHSGPGGWAPGMIGSLIAGDFNPNIVDALSTKFLGALREATRNITPGNLSFLEFEMSNLVKNRLVGEDGEIDPWLKTISMNSRSGNAFLSFFSAHATCFGHDSHHLSSDYPGLLTKTLEEDTTITLAAFGAGAVASMGPNAESPSDEMEVKKMATSMVDQLSLITMMGLSVNQPKTIHSYQLEIPLRAPTFKISKHLALRPYLFENLVGTYKNNIRVCQIGNILFVGVPCDFSGELALPLYLKAREKGLNLVISSFNGSYMGYVIKDEWYDLPKYESRTMCWYGPDLGAYFSEIISRIIDVSPTY